MLFRSSSSSSTSSRPSATTGPLVLLGASIGGLLAYEVAARSPHVAAVAATCLLNPGDWRARAHMTHLGTLGVLGGLFGGHPSDAQPVKTQQLILTFIF